jgi:hypothetical protein
MLATTVTEMTATLKELQLVSECVARNKLVQNILFKLIALRLGELNPKPQQNLVMNNVEID